VRVAALLLCLGLALPAAARPLEADQWDPQTRLWLARAMVGEAGWLAKRDHAGIAHVFLRRWRNMRERWPAMRFRDVIMVYSKSLGDGRSEPTPRQRWVRTLEGAEAPDGWPESKARWHKHVALWQAVLARADAFAAGKLRDPCRGLAVNFGGTIDVEIAKRKGLREIDCGETESTFYDDGGAP
jgi:hypothetical protein